MASFRDMRKLVRLTKEEHLLIAEDEVKMEFAQKHNSDFEWPEEGDIRAKFGQRENIKDTDVADIIDDCLVFNYLRHGSQNRGGEGHTLPLVITSKGRHLLLKLGLIREFGSDNSDWLNAAVAFVVGVLVAGVPFIIYILSRAK